MIKGHNKQALLWVPTLAFSDSLASVVVMTLSVLFYKQMGLSNAAITFYTSWMYLPWILKPVWSPLIDQVKTKRWWVLLTQTLLGAGLGGLAFTIPTSWWMQGTLFFFWALAFTGATHCVAADGFYILGLSREGQAMFMGVRSLAERLATIFGQGVLVMIAGNLQVIFRGSIAYSWSLTFYIIAGLFLLLALWHSWALSRPSDDTQRHPNGWAAIWRGFVEAFISFFKKSDIIAILLFILLFRLPEALMSKVTALFLIDAGHNGGLGLSPQEYGFVQGTVGVIGVTLGGLLGGFVASWGGLRRWLLPMALTCTLPSLAYVFLSYAMTESLFLINVCVFTEQFGLGFGVTAYMLFLISICRGTFRTSHYAIASALMWLSMMLPGLSSGALQEILGYRHFFVLSLICCAVTITVAVLARRLSSPE